MSDAIPASSMSCECPEGAGASADVTARRLLVKSGSDIIFLDPLLIDWIEADGDYMVLHVDNRSILTRATMARLEMKLDRRQFVRIHRSSMVNIDRIVRISPAPSGDFSVILADGARLKMSRGYHGKMSALLAQAL